MNADCCHCCWCEIVTKLDRFSLLIPGDTPQVHWCLVTVELWFDGLLRANIRDFTGVDQMRTGVQIGERMKDNQAFSLLEMLITLAVLIVTTIVVSNWLQSRRSAQGSAPAAQLRSTNTRFSRNIPFDQALMTYRFSGFFSTTTSPRTHPLLSPRTLSHPQSVMVGFSTTDHLPPRPLPNG